MDFYIHECLASLITAFLYFSEAIISSRTSPIRVIIGTTNAFPMQKYLICSGIPAVQLSGNPFRRSHSTGVSTRSRPVVKSCTTCDVRPTRGSDVSNVREACPAAQGIALCPPKRNTCSSRASGATPALHPLRRSTGPYLLL